MEFHRSAVTVEAGGSKKAKPDEGTMMILA
jgi:hypothetical protein